MKRLLFVLALVVLLAAALTGTRVLAQMGPWLDLSPYPGGPAAGSTELPPGTIEIPPDDVETFFAHIGWTEHDGELLHIEEVSWSAEWSDPTGIGNTEVLEWLVQPSQVVPVSEWFPWNVVHTWGVPSTLFSFQADVVFTDATGALHGPILSNIVYKHITPEPSSALALGIGALSLGGAFWRRRRK